jgi:AAHS family 4-hydroxybenzoate transporter-like MFS transporter
MNQPSSLDVQSFLNTYRFSGFQWRVFAICMAIVLLDGFDTASIGYVAPSLLKEWGGTRAALAPVLSAALFGLAAGAFAAGPLSDRFGRRRVLLVSVTSFGLASLACGLAGDIDQLAVLRFFTGLGLGAAMPNAVTLMSEYCPDQRRATLTNLMFCGFPLGAACGGFLAAWIIPQWGWRAVFMLGGATPLLLAALMLTVLPESVRYMVTHAWPAERLRAVLRRIDTSADRASAFTMTEIAPATKARGGIGLVLSRPYIVGSVMLWTSYFMGLVIFYALINWMPVLFKDVGLEPRTATLISALFPLGGVGAVLLGWLMDRFNPNRVIAVGFGLTAVAVYAIGQVSNSIAGLVVAVFGAGLLMNMSQSSLPTLAAAFYPTQGRATGVAWMMAIGRFGGIAGSLLIAEMSARHFGFGLIFAVMAIPALIASVALFVKGMAQRGAAREAGTAPATGTH